MPELEGFDYIVEILFSLGPTRGELPLSECDFDSWERRRGIDLEPWEAETIVDLSKAYIGEAHAAKDMTALAPWPKARSMWKYVMDKKHEQTKAAQKEKEPDGPRKRHRNPPPR